MPIAPSTSSAASTVEPVRPSRRAVIAGSAWAVSLIVTATAVPAFAAASGIPVVTASTPTGSGPAAGDVIITVTVTDTSGTPLSGRAVSFTGPSGVSFSPANPTTDESGVATSTMTTSNTWAKPGSSVTVTALVNGASGTVTVTQLGANAYVVGSNASGKAGVPSGVDTGAPVQPALAFSSPIRSVASGTQFSLALLEDGTVWAVGDNTYGQLADGTTTSRSTWDRITGLSGVVALAAGDVAGVALLSDGTIRTWGDNSVGQLGDGSDVAFSTTLVTVLGIDSAVSVAVGNNNAYAALADGTVRAWGDNDYGQLGDGTTTHSSTPVVVTGISSAVQVASGAVSAYALLTNGEIRAWGSNDRGRLGDGTTTNSSIPVSVSGITSAVQISGGFVSAYARLGDGTVMSWGGNDSGQLGVGTSSWSDATSIPVSVPGVSTAVQISAAAQGAYALCSDGTIYAWGSNAATTPTTSPVVVTGTQNVTRLMFDAGMSSQNTLFLITGDRIV